jgi:glycosyltransferase involved in cell wall biosynthesis
MKNVCIITTVHSAFDDRIFYKEALSLNENGFHVMIIAQHPEDIYHLGIYIKAIPEITKKIKRILFSPIYVIRLARKSKADIFHLHDPEIYWLGLILKVFFKGKIVIDIHENYHRIIKSKVYKRIMQLIVVCFYKAYERICISCASAVIYAVSDIRENHQQVKINNEVIKNFPEIHILAGVRKTHLKQQIIYIGDITIDRGIVETIQAFNLVRQHGFDVNLKLIGPIHLERKYIQQSQKNKHIHFTGFLKREEVIKEIRLSDVGICLLHPKNNYLYSYPVKIFEYMACGIPVLASNFTVFQEIVEKNKCGITVDPFDIKKIASSMMFFLKHPERANEMGKNGIKAIRENYNWSNEMHKLIQLYKKL